MQVLLGFYGKEEVSAILTILQSMWFASAEFWAFYKQDEKLSAVAVPLSQIDKNKFDFKIALIIQSAKHLSEVSRVVVRGEALLYILETLMIASKIFRKLKKNYRMNIPTLPSSVLQNI